MTVRALIVDDHEAVRAGLAALFSGSPISIAGEVSSGKEVISSIESLNESPNGVDVVLLDIQLPGDDGLTTLSRIREHFPTLPVVMMSAFENPIYVARATANGAQDFVYKSEAVTMIIQTLSHAVATSSPHPEGVLHEIQQRLTRKVDPNTLPKEFPLTGREAQVLRHVAMGLSNREIGKSLGISIETVKEHVQNILRKTEASDRTDIAVRAVRQGLVD